MNQVPSSRAIIEGNIGFSRMGQLSGFTASDGCPVGAAFGIVLDLWLGRRAAFQL